MRSSPKTVDATNVSTTGTAPTPNMTVDMESRYAGSSDLLLTFRCLRGVWHNAAGYMPPFSTDAS